MPSAIPRRRLFFATTMFSISHTPATFFAQANPEIFPPSSATRTIPDSRRRSYCSRVQWAALAASCSIARKAGTSSNTAERIVTGMRISEFRLGENLSIRMAHVVGFKIFGKDSFTSLDALPAQASDLAAAGVGDLLDSESCIPDGVGNARVGSHHELVFGFRKKLFPAQQALAIHSNRLPNPIITNVEIAPPGVQNRKNTA